MKKMIKIEGVFFGHDQADRRFVISYNDRFISNRRRRQLVDHSLSTTQASQRPTDAKTKCAGASKIGSRFRWIGLKKKRNEFSKCDRRRWSHISERYLWLRTRIVVTIVANRGALWLVGRGYGLSAYQHSTRNSICASQASRKALVCVSHFQGCVACETQTILQSFA